MTDTTIADKVYMEPLTVEYLAKILRFERPDALVSGEAAAGAPKGEGRTEDHRVADVRRGLCRLLQVVGDLGGDHRLAKPASSVPTPSSPASAARRG